MHGFNNIRRRSERVIPRRQRTPSTARPFRATSTRDDSAWDPTRLHRRNVCDHPTESAQVRRISTIREYRSHRSAAGCGDFGLRQGRWRFRAVALCDVLLSELAGDRGADGRPVQASRNWCVSNGIGFAPTPDHAAIRWLRELGRDLRPPRCTTTKNRTVLGVSRRRRRPRTLDLGSHARRGPRFLHRVGPRPTDLAASLDFSQPGRAGSPLGRGRRPGARPDRTRDDSAIPRPGNDRRYVAGRRASFRIRRCRRQRFRTIRRAASWGVQADPFTHDAGSAVSG